MPGRQLHIIASGRMVGTKGDWSASRNFDSKTSQKSSVSSRTSGELVNEVEGSREIQKCLRLHQTLRRQTMRSSEKINCTRSANRSVCLGEPNKKCFASFIYELIVRKPLHRCFDALWNLTSFHVADVLETEIC